jgi:hypothetical protein
MILKYNQEKVKIFPNPATDHIYINYSNSGTEPVGICIYSMNGALVTTLTDKNPKNGLNTIRLDFNGPDKPEFKPGLYLCRLNTKNGTKTGIFIIR